MLAIAMLILSIPCGVILKMWTEERSRKRWLCRNGQSATELARQEPNQLRLSQQLFYAYQPSLIAWIGMYVWMGAIFSVFLWLSSCDVTWGKTPSQYGF